MNTMSTKYTPAGGVSTSTVGKAPGGGVNSELLDFAKEMARRRFVPEQQAAPKPNVGGIVSAPAPPNAPSAVPMKMFGTSKPDDDPLKSAREEAIMQGPPKVWSTLTNTWVTDPTSAAYKRWSVLTGDSANKGEASFFQPATGFAEQKADADSKAFFKGQTW